MQIFIRNWIEKKQRKGNNLIKWPQHTNEADCVVVFLVFFSILDENFQNSFFRTYSMKRKRLKSHESSHHCKIIFQWKTVLMLDFVACTTIDGNHFVSLRDEHKCEEEFSKFKCKIPLFEFEIWIQSEMLLHKIRHNVCT